MGKEELRTVVAVGALVLASACKGPSVPHPMTSQTRYLCCNMRYEKPEVSDANYLKGTLIPFGTRVQILEVGRKTVKFQPAGHPPITFVLKYGDKVLTMDQCLDRLFLAEDPHAKLMRVRDDAAPQKAPRKGERARNPERASDRVGKLIDQGVVDVGMTRDQVLMALGYPPAHRTPALDAPVWTYWQNRWATMQVYFDGDRVARVER